VDALCAKTQWLRDSAPARGPAVPIAAPAVAIADSPPAAAVDPIDGTVVYTTRISPKFSALSARWQQRGFTASLVVIETGTASRARRLAAAMRRRADDSIRRCGLLGWKYALAPSLNAQKALTAIARVKPALAIHAGAGILHEAVLALPRLGTIGAHMGLLPRFRGMNVAEWAALTGSPVGCSGYWMTRGIDTGPVAVTREVDVAGCTTIEELRACVDAAQLDELDAVVRMIVEERRLPRAQQQRAGDGRQFYRMHADLRALLEARLR